MERIAVKRCESYDRTEIKGKLEHIFSHLGGIDRFISSGDTVLLKINLLMGKPPEAAVTTHPVLAEVLAEMFLQAGAGKIVIGDSPGGPFKKTLLKRYYKKSGFLDLAEPGKIELNYDLSWEQKSVPQGKVSKSFRICEFVNQADVIINLPKLKTHGLTRFTGAVKNLFGVIPGLKKGEYHLKTTEVNFFCEMLLDLWQLINPDLNIFDGVWGMEGEGPSGGRPRKFNYIMAGESAVALDTVAAYLLGFDSLDSLALLKNAQKRGLPAVFADLDLRGDELIPAEDVDIPAAGGESKVLGSKFPESLNNLANYLLRPRPKIMTDICVGCARCAQSCPADTIRMEKGKAVIELGDCIRCFCCQELCPHEAVEIKRPFLGRLLFE